GTGKWAVSVIDKLSCPGYPDIEKRIVLVSDIGDSLIVFYQLPDEAITCTFSGTYKFGDKSTRSLQSQSITVTSAGIHEADTNHDGIVSRSELGVYITKWIAGDVSRTNLGGAIQIWSAQ
ncbi:unnamed protein product, partial [marine sediment metagenome]